MHFCLTITGILLLGGWYAVAAGKDDSDSAAKTRSRIRSEALLRNRLFENYDRRVRPSGNTTDVVSLYVSMMLLHIEGIDEQRQVFKVHTWTGFRWNDVRLKWDSPNFSNITVLHTADEELWLPDVALYNSAEGKDTHNYGPTTAMVQSNGDVLWIPPASYSAQCSMNFDAWPRDKHRCHLILGSWTQHGWDIDLQLADRAVGVDQTNFVENDQWYLTNVSASRTTVQYSCCPEPYVSLTFAFQFRRNPSHYVNTLVVPVIALLLASWFLFAIPDLRFRLIVGLLQILALCGESVFLYTVTPPTFGTPPIVRLVAVSVGLILYALIWCMILDRIGQSRSSIPLWIQTKVNGKLSGLLGLTASRFWKPDRVSGGRSHDADKECLTMSCDVDDGLVESELKREVVQNESSHDQNPWQIFAWILSRLCLVHYVILTIVVMAMNL